MARIRVSKNFMSCLRPLRLISKKSSSLVLVVSQGPGKAQGRNKGKHKANKAKEKGKTRVETQGQPPAKKAKVAGNAKCFYCHDKGH
jgi:hypothetical protein